MDKLTLIKALLEIDSKQVEPTKNNTFLEVGKIYGIRTVTMIYVGRLIAYNESEFLFDDVAWIPETERWADFAKTGAHKEAEPYSGKVVIGRGALLDAFELPTTIRDQK